MPECDETVLVLDVADTHVRAEHPFKGYCVFANRNYRPGEIVRKAA